MDLPSLDVLPPEIVCNIVSNVTDLATINEFISVSKKYTNLIYECVHTLTSKQTVSSSLILNFKNLREFQGYILINSDVELYLITQYCKNNKLMYANFVISESYIYSRSYAASFYMYNFVNTYLHNATQSIAQKLYDSRFIFIANTPLLENSIIFNPPIIRIIYIEPHIEALDDNVLFYDDVDKNYTNMYTYLKSVGFLREIQTINNSNHINELVLDNIFHNPIESLLIDDPIFYVPPYVNSDIGILQLLSKFKLYVTPKTVNDTLIELYNELERTQNYKNDNMVSFISPILVDILPLIITIFPNLQSIGIDVNNLGVSDIISNITNILIRHTNNITLIYLYNDPTKYSGVITINNSTIQLINIQSDTQTRLLGLV